MKANDFIKEKKSMSLEELKNEELELKKELFKLRYQSATSPIDNPMKIKFIKRDIAIIKTIIREKEMAAKQ